MRCRAIAVVMVSATAAGLAACREESASAITAKATPVYNKETGKLEQLQSDTNGDGRTDARAFMDGTAVTHTEVDRDHDGHPDRWEYYAPASATLGARPLLVRAEEANGPDRKVTRREHFERGVIRRVEEDTDFDGRLDKWETYERGALVRMDLDLIGRGSPDRRLVYDATGTVVRVEVDPDGDGTFEKSAIR